MSILGNPEQGSFNVSEQGEFYSGETTTPVIFQETQEPRAPDLSDPVTIVSGALVGAVLIGLVTVPPYLRAKHRRERSDSPK